MASTAVNVEWQTRLVVQCLFEDEDEDVARPRRLDCGLETDGPASEGDSFDPVVVADRLRRIADSLNEDPKFKAALTELKQAAAQEALEAAFSKSVDTLCQSKAIQTAEVVPEMQLIRASVAFGLFVTRSAPQLKNKIQGVVTSFLTSRVGDWVNQQGGWDKVPGV